MQISTRFTGALAVSALLTAALVGCAGSGTSTPEETVEGYLNAVADGDVEKALGYFENDEIRTVEVVQIKDATIEEVVAVSDTQSRVGIRYGEKNVRDKSSTTIKLEKIDGEWQITSRPHLLTGG